MRVGGAARELLTPGSRDELIAATLDVWGSGEEWLVLGGGSNLVVADEGFDGSVIRVVTRGIETVSDDGSRVVLRVQAGESWDDLVAHTVDNGLAGIEALSGIPGSTGAAPVQNIGAYGQEISSSLVAVEFLDYLSGDLQRLTAADLRFDYRTSALKQGTRGLVVSVELELERSAEGAPVAYAQLASSLGVELGDRVSLREVRDTVLALRASKGMVLDPADPDSVSCGSFFTNPIVGENFARTLPEQAPRWANAPEPASVAARADRLPGQAQRGLADREVGHRPRLLAAGVARGDLQQAHARDREHRGSDRSRCNRAGALRADPRVLAVRGADAGGAGARRGVALAL
jgi:UDP-N-acetylmuramate dehydrogenase